MAVLVKDSKLPENASKELLLNLHCKFVASYGKDKKDYEYVMSEFLRINGIYWGLTVMDLMGKKDDLDLEEVIHSFGSIIFLFSHCFFKDC